MSLKKFIGSFELYLGAVISGAMFLVLFAQVVSRYVFNSAFSWSEELALILFIWSIYFGATAAIKKHQHLRLEILVDKFSPKVRLVFDLIANFFFALFNCIILAGVVPIVQRLYNAETATAVLEIPKFINYGALPVLFILMVIRLVEDSRTRVNDYRLRKPADGGASPAK